MLSREEKVALMTRACACSADDNNHLEFDDLTRMAEHSSREVDRWRNYLDCAREALELASVELAAWTSKRDSQYRALDARAQTADWRAAMQSTEPTHPAGDVREAIAKAVFAADEPTLDYERHWPSETDEIHRGEDAWRYYLGIADRLIATGIPVGSALELGTGLRSRETVSDEERWAINGALIEELATWMSELDAAHARKPLLDRIVRALDTYRNAIKQ